MNRFTLEHRSQVLSYGRCIEKSDIGLYRVLKQVWQESFPKRNTIDIAEYKIENMELRPDHESKVNYMKRYDFGAKPGNEEMKVKVLPKFVMYGLILFIEGICMSVRG